MQEGSYEYEEMRLYFVESLVMYVSTLHLKAWAHTKFNFKISQYRLRMSF